jgi:hypothetical protein
LLPTFASIFIPGFNLLEIHDQDFKVNFKVKVTLLLPVYRQSVRLGIKPWFGPHRKRRLQLLLYCYVSCEKGLLPSDGSLVDRSVTKQREMFN